MTDSKPSYIYKIVPSSSPVPSLADLPERLPVSDLDQSSGFIHLSTAPQVSNTLKFFFKDDVFVYILRLPYAPLEDKGLIKWEDPKAEVCGPRGGEGMFPHLYNGFKLGKDEIERVEIVQRQGDGWGEAIAKAQNEWLVL
ncbi:hypothetical protein VKT23_017310 [Stygiomarasmius scandens]|uniref:Uncharacterized protein n=1 Tax=Marasmiellus scandens TaxID=2682957 RepID=A0ABR1IVN8_9AGAR